MATSEDIGNITTRLAMVNISFLHGMLEAADNSKDRLLPGDVDIIKSWANVIHILRNSIEKQTMPSKKL